MQTVLFEFEATECNGWPKIRIGIDGDVLVDHDFTSSHEYVEVKYDVVDGAHTFDIERWGKQNFNIVHDQGIILQDQTVTLKNIWVQDVCLPEWVKSQGTFRFDDVTLPAGLTWGPNGVYSIPAQTPLVNWIVHQNTQRNGSMIGLFVPTEVNQQALTQALEKFKQDLGNVGV